MAKNIFWGDAFTLKIVGEHPKPIVFSEWSPVNGSQIKRRDFEFHALIAYASGRGLPLMAYSDEGKKLTYQNPLKNSL